MVCAQATTSPTDAPASDSGESAIGSCLSREPRSPVHWWPIRSAIPPRIEAPFDSRLVSRFFQRPRCLGRHVPSGCHGNGADGARDESRLSALALHELVRCFGELG